jgi:antitoxin component YwqK of YwqJK toxin-antitoxin module
MNKFLLCLVLSIISHVALSQSTDDRVLYIIDSVAVIDDPVEDDQINNDEIDHLEVVTNSARIKALGYEDKADKIIYITTKNYLTRPEEIKRIPSTKNMVRKDGKWFNKNMASPYSGLFIDYFMNGKKQGEGTLKDGTVDGIRTVYYPNGNKRYFYTYANGVKEGLSEEYFRNGNLKQKGSFVNENETGLWQVFYSTGKLKRQSSFINNKQDIPKLEIKFYTLLNKGLSLLKAEDYVGAIKKLDEAAKLNADYADLYLYRGTAKLNLFDFDNSVADYDKAIELEPLYMEAISNRAFSRLRKYQLKNSRTLSKNKEVTILASKDKVTIPKEDIEKICADLNLGYSLGDRKPMILDALKEYCK